MVFLALVKAEVVQVYVGLGLSVQLGLRAEADGVSAAAGFGGGPARTRDDGRQDRQEEHGQASADARRSPVFVLVGLAFFFNCVELGLKN